MALEYDICLLSTSVDCAQSTFEDQTTYGTSGNAERFEIANKYLAYKVDQEGQQTLLTITTEPDIVNITGQVDPGNYSPDRIVIPTTTDGWYLLILLTVNIWNSTDAYTAQVEADNNASIVYYTPTERFYRAISDNTNVAPDGPGGVSNWEEVTDLETVVDNTSLTTYRHNDTIACRLEKAYSKELAERATDTLCGECKTFKEIERSDNLNLWLNIIYSANNNQLYNIAEKVSRHIQDQI